MDIFGLHHAQICIPKGAEEEARRFYTGVLRLEEIPKPTSLDGRGGLWLRVGDGEVHIGTEEDVDYKATKAHLAYAVTGLDQWRRRLSDHGVLVDKGIPIPGHRRFEFRDPFGNRVEFIEAQH
jgi:catechol 2,3-dioxygenase-like lactoylglutathione lyase family enzyme